MSARLRSIARETEAIVEAGRYRTQDGREVSIERALTAALSGTRLYGPEPVPVAALDSDRTPLVEVTAESSLRAARRMTGESPGKVAVLNYASARNPGGGYLNGAQAQEEALCRGSALYATLLRAPDYYAHHRAERSAFYTDRVIHSPGVPVFRDDRGRLLDTPYTAGFLTSPAPNAGVIRSRTPEEAHRIPAALASRAERVLEVAGTAGWCWAPGAAVCSATIRRGWPVCSGRCSWTAAGSPGTSSRSSSASSTGAPDPPPAPPSTRCSAKRSRRARPDRPGRTRSLPPVVALPQPDGDQVEPVPVQRARLTPHPVLVQPQYPVQIDPRRTAGAVPGTGPERHPLAVLVVPLAGELHGEQRARRLAGHHQDRPVLAAPVVLLERHPRPDDLPGVRVAVPVGGVRGADRSHVARVGLRGGGRAGRPGKSAEWSMLCSRCWMVIPTP